MKIMDHTNFEWTYHKIKEKTTQESNELTYSRFKHDKKSAPNES